MTAALKFLLDEAQMLPPADITVTGLKKKKVRTKTKPRVVKSTVDPKTTYVGSRAAFHVSLYSLLAL